MITFLHELPDSSKCVAEGGCPKEGVAGLGDSEDTIPNDPNIPNLTTYLNKLPDLSKYRAEGFSPKE